MPKIDKKKLLVSDLIDTYLKCTKPAKVYTGADVRLKKSKRKVWWTYQAGDIIGKLYAWVLNEQDEIFLMFYVNNDLNQKPYYIKLEKKMIDWNFTYKQLEAKRLSNLSWFDKWVEDIEAAAEDSFKKSLGIGAAILGAYLLFEYIKYEISIRRVERVIKTAAGEFKK